MEGEGDSVAKSLNPNSPDFIILLHACIWLNLVLIKPIEFIFFIFPINSGQFRFGGMGYKIRDSHLLFYTYHSIGKK